MSYHEWLDQLDEVLEKNNTVNKYLDILEKKTNVKKRYIALGEFPRAASDKIKSIGLMSQKCKLIN